MNCCSNKKYRNQQIKEDRVNSGENTYPGTTIVKNIMKDITPYPQDNNFIKSILWGAQWTNLPNNKLTYCINFGSSSISTIGGITLITPTSSTVSSVDQCMTDLGDIINLSVEKTTNVNEAVLSFNFIDRNQVNWLGMANPPVVTNDFYYNVDSNLSSLTSSFYAPGNIYISYNTSLNFQKGSYNYITIVHELGHALGLAHPHDTGGNSTIFSGVTSPFGDFGDYNANQQPFTIMTYNDIASPNVPDTQQTSGFLATFGAIDIVALQYMYGKNPNFNSGNTTYTFPNSSENKYWETIYDTGGINTIDSSSSTSNTVIDLNDAAVQPNTNNAGIPLSFNIFGGLTISKDVVIQNVITGQGNDIVTGNEQDNEIKITKGGNDEIDGKSGYDTVIIQDVRSNFTITIDENTNTATLTDGQNSVVLKNCEKIVFNDETIIISEYTPPTSSTFQVEYNSTLVSSNWKTITLSKPFSKPVIIVSDPTFNNSDSVVVRIRNITSNSFECKLQETSNLNNIHPNETISYIVGEEGSWNIGDTVIQFGSVTTNQIVFKGSIRVNFPTSYSTLPSIFTQVQTNNDTAFVGTRIRSITNSYFLMGLEEEEKYNRGTHGTEKIGWMSLTQGIANDNGTIFETKIVDKVRHQNRSVTYTTSFLSPPILFTKLISYKGRDSANTRVISNSTTGFVAKVHEDKSKDREIRHVYENISYLVIGTPLPPPEPKSWRDVTEQGSISLSTKWKTISLLNNFTNPIVIMSDPTQNNNDSVVVRIRNISPSSFECRLQETSNLDGNHPNETISYIVGEEGTWNIENNMVEFGKISTNKMILRGSVKVTYSTPYSSIPSIFTQVQTFNDSSFVGTRTKSLTNSSFLVGLEEEERYNRGSHGTETIGWMSIQQGILDSNGTKIETKIVGNVTHQNKTIQYSSAFSSEPLLLTKLVSHKGRDSANTRIVSNSPTQFIIKIREDISKDRETRHIKENISYIAIV